MDSTKDTEFMAGAVLPTHVRDAIVKVGEVIEVAEGELLFSEDDVGKCMYVIEEGAIRIRFGLDEASKLVGPGQFLGEISLLAPGMKRTATAVGHSPSRLRVLSEATINALRESHPDLLCTLLQETCSYLIASERSLLDRIRQRNRELERTLDYLRRTKQELELSDLLAQTDELTNLYNRRCLNQQLPVFMTKAQSTSSNFSLLLIDVDKFKPINDTHGHDVGDRVLCEIAKILQSRTRQSDFPCRIGGDEFAILLGDTSPETAQRRALEFVKDIEALDIQALGGSVKVTVSVGGSMYRDGDDDASLMKRADQALYQAKDAGRNEVSWIDAPAS